MQLKNSLQTYSTVYQDKYGWSPLHCAVHHGSDECARLLVKLGADISLSCCVGKSPLHMACTMNRTALCEFLLIAGADPNLQVFGCIIMEIVVPSACRCSSICYILLYCLTDDLHCNLTILTSFLIYHDTPVDHLFPWSR